MSVWLPTAPCTPADCASPRWPTVRRSTAVLRLAAGTAAVLAGVVLAPVAVPLGPAGRARLAALWCRTVMRAFGVRIRVTGAVPGERVPGRPGPGTLVVPNHISWLDIPLVASVLPGRMLAKREVRRWPVLGPLARFGGTLFVDRDRLRELPAVVGAVAGVLRRGSRVVVFPEGSTWCGRERGRFRYAAFQAALDAGAVVRPVHIAYRPVGAAAFVGDDALGASLWRVATAAGLTAEITVLPPIPAAAHADRRSLARAAQRALGRAAVPGAAAVPHRRPGGPRTIPAQTIVDRDSANLPSASVHHSVSFIPAAASSERTPS
ncbi:1-acyl-sn-glycerol-3-phosphate acyltransferase [Streptomyces sp. PKU-MA01144]|uniref:lysophospholipid acyltransferase family protein n=1 Tax=Streptomyces TaxID=1883 RepID=UPI0003719EA2|nr:MULTISPECIES: lysophospholipid acyltransferase family protein [Streptomyces]MCY0985152.1 lysophospholipid acyltransferase family protein [Streptomyces tirandamycinicus]NNJ05009.1 1-acyl-sn-glycerol-3-phosphate acyltransferase [Streptomyces sp. PKU-MA01144]